MSAGQFRAGLPEMAAATRHVNEVNAGIQADLMRLMNQLEPLFGTWQGSAATRFHTVKERWHANATRLNQALAGIAEIMEAGQRNYTHAEASTSRGFARIDAVL